MDKTDNKIMIADAIALYTAIKDIVSEGLEGKVLMSYIKLRLKLRDIADKYEVVRRELSDQTRPKGWKEGDDTTEWNEKFQPLLYDYLAEKIDLDTKILTEEQAIELVMANKGLPGSVGDIIIGMMSSR